MRFKISQRLLADSRDLIWVVVDTETGKIVSKGSWTSCANSCRELNDNIPSPTITQEIIDGDGTHRNRFFAMLSQIRAMVKPSTQIVK
jgi:hypothetical protein